jgi:hypothetical protein
VLGLANDEIDILEYRIRPIAKPGAHDGDDLGLALAKFETSRSSDDLLYR